jgi:hypothetical protein
VAKESGRNAYWIGKTCLNYEVPKRDKGQRRRKQGSPEINKIFGVLIFILHKVDINKQNHSKITVIIVF